jgi:predicted metal-dependent hydrolase
MPKFLINQFINQQQAWIEKHLAKIKIIQRNKISTDIIQLFGKKYQLKLINDPNQDVGIKIQGQQLFVNSLVELTPAKVKDKLELFIKGTAEKYLFPRTYQLGKLMKIEFKKITLRQQKSRWGSCSSRGTLSFNWRLAHFEPAVIDYVIIHELAHRVHMDHSAAFWRLVAIYDPKHKLHRRILKQYQS